MHCTKCLGRKCGGWWLPLAVHAGAQTASAGRWLETEVPPRPTSSVPLMWIMGGIRIQMGLPGGPLLFPPPTVPHTHTHTPLPSPKELTAFFSLSAFYIFTYNRLCWTLLSELPVCRTTLIVIVKWMCSGVIIPAVPFLLRYAMKMGWKMSEWLKQDDSFSHCGCYFLITPATASFFFVFVFFADTAAWWSKNKKWFFSVSPATLQRSSQWLMGRLSTPYWSEAQRPPYWSSLQSCRSYLHFC